jgi:uncharacterized protein (TIGR02246 family)
MRTKICAAAAAATGLALTAVVTLSACSTAVKASAPTLPSQQGIAALYPVWNAALATGDPQKVADLYAPEAVLLPTLSNKMRSDRAGIVDYFTKFLASKPQGKIDSEFIDVLDADSAINTGIYTFTLMQDGRPQQVQARYTYVYEHRDGRWLIANHHSSAMPER